MTNFEKLRQESETPEGMADMLAAIASMTLAEMLQQMTGVVLDDMAQVALVHNRREAFLKEMLDECEEDSDDVP